MLFSSSARRRADRERANGDRSKKFAAIDPRVLTVTDMTLRLTINLRHPPRCHTRVRAMHQLVRSLARSLGGFATLASTGRSARTCATWSAATAARGASAAEGALRAPDRASSFGHPSRGFASFGVLRNAAPPASRRGQVRGKTKGVGVHVGADGDVDRAMRKLKRVMINEGIERSMKKRLVFLKGSDANVVARRERDHRKWKKALRSKLGWIMRRKDRGF